MLRSIAAALAAALALAGCAQKEAAAPKQASLDHLQKPGCYTVDLFDPVTVEDGNGLPQDYARWLGRWGGGVWNGSWCHEMIVAAVSPQGEVTLYDMHAPSETFSAPATVFRRKGRIHDDGSLRFAHGTVVRHYELREGKLHGWREGDGHGRLQIVMQREGAVPMPRARPVRLAKN